MAFPMPLGRLFWKLVLALSMSMVLTMVGGVTYLLLSGRSPPPIPQGEPMIGFIPVVPLLSALIAICVIGLHCDCRLSACRAAIQASAPTSAPPVSTTSVTAIISP